MSAGRQVPAILRCSEFIIIRDSIIKKKMRQASVNQKFFEDASLLIVVCSNTSRSAGRYGQRGRDFYGIIDVELPEYVKPLGVIALGYPDESPAKMERMRMNSLCTMNAGN